MAGTVGKNEPYRAPVYRTYMECIKSLKNQGVLGFYKGNLLRQSNFLVTAFGQIIIGYKLQDMFGGPLFFYYFLGGMIADVLFHPMHLAESRYILQNR